MNEIINLGNGAFVKITMLKGEQGTNIASIVKTSTDGLIDTYTVTLTNGDTTTFQVTNGANIGVANLAFVQADNVAQKAFAVGKHLVLNDQYCIVTQAILEGDTIEIGTNVNESVVGDEISDLEDRKANKTEVNELASDKADKTEVNELATDKANQSDLNIEIQARTSADSNLQSQINQIIAPSGTAPSAAEVENARIGADNKTYSTLGDAIRTQFTNVKGLIDECLSKTVLGIQLFNKNTINANCYVSYSTGELSGYNANFYASDYIPVVAGKKYYLEYTGNQQLAFYDKNKQYVSGLTTANALTSTPIPDGCCYLRFTGTPSDIDNCILCLNTDLAIIRNLIGKDNTNIDYGFVADRLSEDNIEIEYTAYSNVALANGLNSAKVMGPNRHMTIYLAEGTHYITPELLTNYNVTTYGLIVPNNVDIIGLGKGATLYCGLTGESATMQQNVSTLNTTKNNKLENLTLIAKNCRYALHNDFGEDGNFTQEFKNCKFIHQGCPDGNWLYAAAVGEGTKSGAKVTYENCTFKSTFRGGYLHNNTNFAKASHHLYKNCQFISTGEDDPHVAFQLESMGSGVNDIVEFDGCTFSGIFDCRARNSESAQGNDFRIIGHGNGKIPFNPYFTNGVTYYVEDERIQLITNKTANTWSSRTPIKCVNGNFEPMTSDDSIDKCIGVTIESIAPSQIGAMQTDGYLNVTGISNTVGAKIGIVNGALSVVNNDEYIGIVKYYESTFNRAYMNFA